MDENKKKKTKKMDTLVTIIKKDNLDLFRLTRVKLILECSLYKFLTSSLL